MSLNSSMMFYDQALPTIMIADRDDEERCLLRAVFELKGFTVLEAMDGQQAFDLASQEHPDLIFIDLKLPVADAFTFIRRIRKLTGLQRTPIVAVSERIHAHQRLAIAAGCAAHLNKPFQVDELTHLVERLLPHSRVEIAANFVN